MKRMSLVITLVLVFVLVGCGGEEAIKEPEVESILTKEMEQEITKWIDDATMYDKTKLEGDDETLTVWIDLKDEATTSAEEYANGLAERIAKLYDYDVSIQVTAMQSIEGSDKVRAFGNSSFTPDSGKVEYKTY